MKPVDAIAAALGVALDNAEPARSGQGRTFFADLRGGSRAVVKWSSDERWASWLPNAIAGTEQLRGRGYPAPSTIVHGPVPGLGHAWVQERLPGTSSTAVLSTELLGDVLAAIELQADACGPLAVERSWSWVPAVVFDDEAGWWRAARSLTSEVVDLCDEIEAWVGAVPRAQIRTDWTHLDVNFTNVLAVEGRLSGIVDMDLLGIGDRTVDLAYLAFEYERARFRGEGSPAPSAVERLRDRALAISGEPGWRQAVAYCAISSLGWSNADGMRVPLEMACAVARRFVQQGI